MSAAVVLRAAAIAAALGAVVDFEITREAPAGVIVRSGSRGEPAEPLAARVRDQLAAAMRGRIDLDPPGAPAAVILTGPVADLSGLPDGVPVSIVNEGRSARRNLQVSSVAVPPVVLTGTTGSVAATVAAAGAAGETTAVVLLLDGVPVDRLEHTWTADDEMFEARFALVAPVPGVRALRIAAGPIGGEDVIGDNHADARLMVRDRRLRVLVYEPRPSWTTTFVRRVLEGDSLFEVAALTRPTRGIAVRAGAAPERLRPDVLEPFDAVVVGAPEELTENEVKALDGFARQRGGTFVLVPDRRPTGAYVALVPAGSFDERLLEKPVTLLSPAGALRSSELAVPARWGRAVEPVATLDAADGSRIPIVMSWPLGIGRGVISGALDAWRHRERDDEFATFWRAQIAAAALAAPPPVAVTLEPGMAAPGDPILLTVRVRPTEARQEGAAVELPVVRAQLTRPDGLVEPIRVLPRSEPGVFEGRFDAPAPGTYLVRASVPDASFETALVVAGDARAPRPDLGESARLLAHSTGGAAATDDDLSSVVAHLHALPAGPVARRVHPARSPWWMAGFVALACAEWALRRKRGRR